MNIKRMLTRHNLARIELVLTGDSIHARAFPATWNPIVTERREQGIAKLAVKYPDGIPLSQMQPVTEDSMKLVGRARGESIDLALENLDSFLKDAHL
jgi:hypothetical protein